MASSMMNSFTTTVSIHLWILILVTLLGAITAHPIINTKDEHHDDTVSAVSSSITHSDIDTSQLCKHQLKQQIENCLTPFEQKLIVFKAEDTSAAERHDLRASFCHEYEITLQCLHLVLLRCPPSLEHLNLIEHRVGYLVGYMNENCYIRPEDMTPAKPKTTTTVAPPTTTTSPTTRPPTTRPRTITTFGSIITKGPSANTRPTRRTTTFDMAQFSNKLHGGATTTTLPLSSSEKVELIDASKNAIPMGVVEESKSPHPDNGIVDTNMILVSSQVDCHTPDGRIDRRCASFPDNSGTNSRTVPVTVLVISLLSAVYTLLH